MKLSEFKVVKNRKMPEMCYSYEKYNLNKTDKYSIFTMDSGKTFLSSVISINHAGELVDTDYSKTFNSANEGLVGIVEYLKNK